VTTLRDIRDGLVDVLGQLEGCSAGPALTQGVPLPFFLVVPPLDTDFHLTFGREGAMAMDWTVVGMVGMQLTSEAEDALLDMCEPLGPRSVYDALHQTTLGGRVTAGQVTPMSFRRLGADEVSGLGHQGVEFVVHVVMTKES
jgi:hypothetical protein